MLLQVRDGGSCKYHHIIVTVTVSSFFFFFFFKRKFIQQKLKEKITGTKTKMKQICRD